MIGLKKHTMFFGLTLGLLFSACSGENNNQTETPERDIVGQLIDSAVEGVEYRCGELIDFTDENGTFSCSTLPVSFYIGAINLGELPSLPIDNQVFPQDIIDVNRSDVNNSQVVKLALLLQSLDEDNNVSNGIHISNQTSHLFDEEVILSEITIDELKNTVQNKDKNITFKDIDEVINHLSFSVGIIHNETPSIIDTSSDTNNSVDNTETNTTTIIDNSSESNNTTIDTNTTIIIDTIAPNIPTLTVTPTTTEEESINVEVNGEVNSTIFVNAIKIIQIDNSGKATITLNTSGSDGNKIFTITLKDLSNNQSEPLVVTVLKRSPTILDTTAPNAPRVTTIPQFTNLESTAIQVNGEANSVLFINNLSSGSLNSQGVLNTSLDTSGEDGEKDFNLTLKDSHSNESSMLHFTIIKDATPPAQNATIDSLTTDDATPPLSGDLPSGDDDTNTSNYIIQINIDNN
jgi:hypothetical protein